MNLESFFFNICSIPRQGERIKKGVKQRQKKPIKAGMEAIMIPETVPPIIDFFSDIKDPRI
ncbi:MAG: hypothetical protein LBE17_02670, partial [Treponema sp.]|nr:hypothetical protein [Treponema sp.]